MINTSNFTHKCQRKIPKIYFHVPEASSKCIERDVNKISYNNTHDTILQINTSSVIKKESISNNVEIQSTGSQLNLRRFNKSKDIGNYLHSHSTNNGQSKQKSNNNFQSKSNTTCPGCFKNKLSKINPSNFFEYCLAQLIKKQVKQCLKDSWSDSEQFRNLLYDGHGSANFSNDNISPELHAKHIKKPMHSFIISHKHCSPIRKYSTLYEEGKVKEIKSDKHRIDTLETNHPYHSFDSKFGDSALKIDNLKVDNNKTINPKHTPAEPKVLNNKAEHISHINTKLTKHPGIKLDHKFCGHEILFNNHIEKSDDLKQLYSNPKEALKFRNLKGTKKLFPEKFAINQITQTSFIDSSSDNLPIDQTKNIKFCNLENLKIINTVKNDMEPFDTVETRIFTHKHTKLKAKYVKKSNAFIDYLDGIKVESPNIVKCVHSSVSKSAPQIEAPLYSLESPTCIDSEYYHSFNTEEELLPDGQGAEQSKLSKKTCDLVYYNGIVSVNTPITIQCIHTPRIPHSPLYPYSTTSPTFDILETEVLLDKQLELKSKLIQKSKDMIVDGVNKTQPLNHILPQWPKTANKLAPPNLIHNIEFPDLESLQFINTSEMQLLSDPIKQNHKLVEKPSDYQYAKNIQIYKPTILTMANSVEFSDFAYLQILETAEMRLLSHSIKPEVQIVKENTNYKYPKNIQIHKPFFLIIPNTENTEFSKLECLQILDTIEMRLLLNQFKPEVEIIKTTSGYQYANNIQIHKPSFLTITNCVDLSHFEYLLNLDTVEMRLLSNQTKLEATIVDQSSEYQNVQNILIQKPSILVILNNIKCPDLECLLNSDTIEMRKLFNQIKPEYEIIKESSDYYQYTKNVRLHKPTIFNMAKCVQLSDLECLKSFESIEMRLLNNHVKLEPNYVEEYSDHQFFKNVQIHKFCIYSLPVDNNFTDQFPTFVKEGDSDQVFYQSKQDEHITFCNLTTDHFQHLITPEFHAYLNAFAEKHRENLTLFEYQELKNLLKLETLELSNNFSHVLTHLNHLVSQNTSNRDINQPKTSATEGKRSTSTKEPCQANIHNIRISPLTTVLDTGGIGSDFVAFSIQEKFRQLIVILLATLDTVLAEEIIKVGLVNKSPCSNSKLNNLSKLINLESTDSKKDGNFDQKKKKSVDNDNDNEENTKKREYLNPGSVKISRDKSQKASTVERKSILQMKDNVRKSIINSIASYRPTYAPNQFDNIIPAGQDFMNFVLNNIDQSMFCFDSNEFDADMDYSDDESDDDSKSDEIMIKNQQPNSNAGFKKKAKLRQSIDFSNKSDYPLRNESDDIIVPKKKNSKDTKNKNNIELKKSLSLQKKDALHQDTSKASRNDSENSFNTMTNTKNRSHNKNTKTTSDKPKSKSKPSKKKTSTSAALENSRKSTKNNNMIEIVIDE